MKTIEGKKAILEQVPDLLYDESRAGGGVPAAVFFPETEEDVRFVVRKAAESGTPVVPAGAQTGITAGSTPPDGCYLLSFSAMNRVTGVTEQEDGKVILTCLPGITLEDIDHLLLSGGEEYPDLPGRDILNEQSLTYFPDPTEMSAALGGTIATNASGARTFAYGPTRNHIETLSFVLASGETCTLKRGQVMAHNGAFTLVTDQGSSLTIPASDYTWPWPKNASGYLLRPRDGPRGPLYRLGGYPGHHNIRRYQPSFQDRTSFRGSPSSRAAREAFGFRLLPQERGPGNIPGVFRRNGPWPAARLWR